MSAKVNEDEKKSDLYVVENGVRKRIVPRSNITSAQPPPTEDGDSTKINGTSDLPNSYTLEEATLRMDQQRSRASLPYVFGAENAMTREESHQLGQRRREERRREREELERRRRLEIVLSLGDFKVRNPADPRVTCYFN